MNCACCLQEAVHCVDCDKDTHVHQYTQYFFNVIAAAVPSIRQVVGEQELGITLRAIEEQTFKSCDSDKGKAVVVNLMQLSSTCAQHRKQEALCLASSSSLCLTAKVVFQLLIGVTLRIAYRRLWQNADRTALSQLYGSQGLHHAAGMAECQ